MGTNIGRRWAEGHLSFWSGLSEWHELSSCPPSPVAWRTSSLVPLETRTQGLHLLAERCGLGSALRQVVTRLIHLLGEKILGSLQQGPATSESPTGALASLCPLCTGPSDLPSAPASTAAGKGFIPDLETSFSTLSDLPLRGGALLAQGIESWVPPHSLWVSA